MTLEKKQIYDLIDTPALLIDYDITISNINDMQKYVNDLGIKLRPHIKTHKMPYFAKIQLERGAIGIACAKIGEAEVMAEHGIKDIFIANEIVGVMKYERLRELNNKTLLSIGVDNKFQVDQIDEVFKNESKPLRVLIEYEVGENRSGIITDEQLIKLVDYIKTKNTVSLVGIFSHEGQSYKSNSPLDAKKEANASYERTLRAAEIIRSRGIDIEIVSVGATPSVMAGAYVEGITEFRIGTYIFFDLGQANAIDDFSKCSATVLTTIISKPNEERVVLDAGAKGLVAQNRDIGICSTGGFGYVKGSDNVVLDGLFDEHGLINNKDFSNIINIGDKIEVIPSHICPTVNLYDKVYLISEDKIMDTIKIEARGKSQ